MYGTIWRVDDKKISRNYGINRMKEFIFSKNHGKINVKEMLLSCITLGIYLQFFLGRLMINKLIEIM